MHLRNVAYFLLIDVLVSFVSAKTDDWPNLVMMLLPSQDDSSGPLELRQFLLAEDDDPASGTPVFTRLSLPFIANGKPVLVYQLPSRQLPLLSISNSIIADNQTQSSDESVTTEPSPLEKPRTSILHRLTSKFISNGRPRTIYILNSPFKLPTRYSKFFKNYLLNSDG